MQKQKSPQPKLRAFSLLSPGLSGSLATYLVELGEYEFMY
uniref:Uncharacterized protein n=2 Tax=Serratia marcescens TaxID=615 RepID=A0A345IPE1_SERMA|nr:hypothetical protein [Serratia marcescens]DAC77061.1 TPA_exp: hypothetical protein [Serratia marcescens BIDMC 80]DAC77105.1 TPA_exp: hypothetical protein [Serratia marcescens]DAC77149.1 TPA_exp: hypothetical protein [Serratia marcescens]DAC77193.1 TPA_exp: hypothetical protein [Serratia marcescens]